MMGNLVSYITGGYFNRNATSDDNVKDFSVSFYRPATKLNQTEFKQLELLIRAIRGHNTSDVKAILERYSHIINVHFEKTTPLIDAIKYKNSEVVDILINAGADITQTEQKYQEPPLFVAIANEDQKTLEEILKRKSNDKQFINKKIGLTKRTALHYSISKNNLEALESILNTENVDVNVVDIDENTPLHLAVEKDLVKMVFRLCSNPKIHYDMKNVNDLTPEKINTPFSVESKKALRNCINGGVNLSEGVIDISRGKDSRQVNQVVHQNIFINSTNVAVADEFKIYNINNHQQQQPTTIIDGGRVKEIEYQSPPAFPPSSNNIKTIEHSNLSTFPPSSNDIKAIEYPNLSTFQPSSNDIKAIEYPNLSTFQPSSNDIKAIEHSNLSTFQPSSNDIKAYHDESQQKPKRIPNNLKEELQPHDELALFELIGMDIRLEDLPDKKWWLLDD